MNPLESVAQMRAFRRPFKAALRLITESTELSDLQGSKPKRLHPRPAARVAGTESTEEGNQDRQTHPRDQFILTPQPERKPWVRPRHRLQRPSSVASVSPCSP